MDRPVSFKVCERQTERSRMNRYEIFKITSLVLLFLALSGSAFSSYAQHRLQPVKGRVIDLYTRKPLENVHVINMTTFFGTTTDENGFFRIEAAQNDSLYISSVGYKNTNVVVSPNMLKREYTPFYISPTVYDLDEVVIRSNHLTCILEVDIRSLDPVFESKAVKLANIKTSENIDLSAAKRLNPLNPVEFINSFFSQDKKLRKMKEENEVANMLAERYDRDFLRNALGMTQEELEELLLYCQQDPKWVLKASDLDLINALIKCKQDMDEKAKAKAEEEE